MTEYYMYSLGNSNESSNPSQSNYIFYLHHVLNECNNVWYKLVLELEYYQNLKISHDHELLMQYLIPFLAFLTWGVTTLPELSYLSKNSSICFCKFPTALTPRLSQWRWNFITVNQEVFCKESHFLAPDLCIAAGDVTASNKELWPDASSSPESLRVELRCLFICIFNCQLRTFLLVSLSCLSICLSLHYSTAFAAFLIF